MIYRERTLRLAGVARDSIVDGPGIRFTVFSQGCPHHCPGCHNQSTHDFEGGKDADVDDILAEIDKNPLLSGVTFSGGEPFSQPVGFYALAREIKKRNLHITVFSGYTYEELTAMSEEQDDVGRAIAGLMNLADLLIDGKFEMSLRDLTLPFRGSSNQRIIDMNQSRLKGEIVLDDEHMGVI